MKSIVVLHSVLLTVSLVVGMAPAFGEQSDENLPKKLEGALSWVQDYAQQAMEQTGIPGLALVVVYNGEVVVMEGYGTRKVGEDWPVDQKTIFQIASLSKPMSSTVVAAAVDRKLVQWNDPVAKYNVGLRLSQPWLSNNVTIADLMSHRSGLLDHAGDYLEDLGFDRATILQRVGLLSPKYPFRDGYAYTNFGFTAGAAAAANAAGMEWPELAEKLVFEPLGMASSSFRFADYDQAENRAYIHALPVDGHPEAKYTRNADVQAPAGALSTNLVDYSKWMRMQLQEGQWDGKQIVSKEALEETWRPHSQTGYNTTTFKAGYYSLGWNVGHSHSLGLKISHSGAFDMGVRTGVTLFPESSLGIAVFANAGTNGVPEAIMIGFEDMIEQGSLRQDWISFANKQFRLMTTEQNQYQVDLDDRPKSAQEPLDFSVYRGTYKNTYYGPLTVSYIGDRLYFEIGPEAMKYDLHPWDGNTFWFEPAGEMSGGPGLVEFEVTDEKACRVTIPYFSEGGFDAFSRVEDDGSPSRSQMDVQALMDDFFDTYGTINYLQIMPPGMIVVAVSGDNVVIRGYGETAIGSGQTPDENTIFGIGSISKVFTGNVLASMVSGGFVDFTTPLSHFLPNSDRLAGIRKNGGELRLIDLATQTSGFPRELPGDLTPAERTIDLYLKWLEDSSLFFEPGTSAFYSNMGFEILGYSLGLSVDTNYPKVLQRFITGPLGMESTGPFETIGEDRKWMDSYGPDGGGIELSATSDVVIASGGLFTTAKDISKWMLWNLEKAADLSEKRLLSQSIYRARDELQSVSGLDLATPMSAMGLGWVATFQKDGSLVINKTGARAGYMSYVALEPGKRKGIFFVMNQFDFAGYQVLVQNMNSLLSQLPGAEK